MVCYVEGEKHADDSTPDASCPELQISQSRTLTQGTSNFLCLYSDMSVSLLLLSAQMLSFISLHQY